MRSSIIRAVARPAALAALATLALTGRGAAAQQTTQATTTTTTTTVTTTIVAPVVGEMAPDFTMAWADGAGPRATPVALSSLRGKVVVLAFYPKDRTTGCTAELTKFRDEHATLFGKDVVVLPVSADSIGSHVSWASEMKFPFALVSDPQLAMADAYGSRTPGRSTANRTLFVIGKDGKVVYREMKFNALNEESYTALASAVAKAR